MTSVGERPIEFGSFSLDTRQCVLLHDGEPVKLGSRAFEILSVLASANGGVVSKDELMAKVWPGIVVEEGNLQVHISLLRKALSERNASGHIMTVPGRGYRLIGTQSRSHGLETGAVFPLPDKPSIAVLPFANITGGSEQEYFADGMVEDIITALSRIRGLFVIARNTSFAYKGRLIDLRQVGRELGVRYVLEGSVRKAGSRIRITGQLIDATVGAYIWADRFDGELEEIFDLQDRVTTSVVASIAPRLEQAEIERAKRKPTENLDAYDYYLKGMSNAYRWTREGINDALRLFYNAIDLDPEFASAYGAAAWCYYWRMVNGWRADHASETEEVHRLSRRVVEFGNDDAVALTFGGIALGRTAGQVQAGITMIDRALLLNSNFATAWSASGFLRTFLGDYDLAIEHTAYAMRLSPLDRLLFHMRAVTGLAHFLAGHDDLAWPLAEQACREQPILVSAVRLAAATNACAGRLREAREFIARALELDPNQRISNLKDRIGPFSPQGLTKYIKGLRLAGMPE